ncbi:MAG: hypothetical protein HYS18_13785 [Burkholderiales bacterium]|nr:hypothetical protein [Burkholderiales bacterium]
MAKNRDNFSPKITKELERRVNGRCSNPTHRVPTSGPSSKVESSNSIGIAAHITAASPGGPRYDASLTQEERKHINNAIWLCSNCATLIDKDPKTYPVELLQQWKKSAELEAQEEMGQIPVSRKTHEQLQALVFGDLPFKRAPDAVSNICHLVASKYKELDPRFDVEIGYQDGKTICTFSATEPVSFAANIANEFALEFREKFNDLISHGKDLEIDAKAITLTGSKLFELTNNQATKFVLSTNLRKNAVTKIEVLDDEGILEFSLDDVLGELVGGKKSVTFSGSTYQGLIAIEFTYEFGESSSENCTISTEIDFSSWNTKTLLTLPYFEKIYKYYDALFHGKSIGLRLEIDGEKVISGNGADFADEDHVGRVYSLLRYIRNVRAILKFIGTDVPYAENIRLSLNDVEDVEYFYNLLIEHKQMRGEQLGTVSFTVIPHIGEVVQSSIMSLMSGEANAIRIEQSFGQPLNLYGTKITLPRIAISYSRMRAQDPINLTQVIPGEAISMKLIPLEDCAMHVELHKSATPVNA